MAVTLNVTLSPGFLEALAGCVVIAGSATVNVATTLVTLPGAIADNDPIIARVAPQHPGQGQCGGGRAGDAPAIAQDQAVLAPLVTQRRCAAGQDAERGGRAAIGPSDWPAG